MRSIGIRGAGVAGLSIARELKRRDPTVAVTLFDRRQRLPHPGRTFCFFGCDASPQGADFAWNRACFRGPGFERSIDVSSSPYCMLRGESFFEETLRELEQVGVRFWWGCDSVEVAGNAIILPDYKEQFDVVVDAAFDPQGISPLLWQSFVGVWVTTEEDSFDPNTALVMDLQESSEESPICFIYSLPISKREALVEHTTFSLQPMSHEYHRESCLKWIRERFGSRCSYGPEERGAIPMGGSFRARSDCFSLGTGAGAVRPSTGYAFQTIQHQARQISGAILMGERPQMRDYSGYSRWLLEMDLLFLRTLVRDPESGGALMAPLLATAPERSLVSFLANNASLWDAVRVGMSLPKIPMLRTLLRL